MVYRLAGKLENKDVTRKLYKISAENYAKMHDSL